MNLSVIASFFPVLLCVRVCFAGACTGGYLGDLALQFISERFENLEGF